MIIYTVKIAEIASVILYIWHHFVFNYGKSFVFDHCDGVTFLVASGLDLPACVLSQHTDWGASKT